MIGKFNFYDIYGYFIPGLVLLTLLLLPYTLVTGKVPVSGELVTALLGIPLAYVVGHLLRCLHVLPSTAEDHERNLRYPSAILLDRENEEFSQQLKDRLRKQILEKLEINLTPPADNDQSRADAFMLCRGVLVEAKSVSYGEQFEGMYALMRGLVVAFVLSSAHFLGWALAGSQYDASLRFWLLIGGLSSAILLACQSQSSRPAFFAILVVLMSSGYILGYGRPGIQDLGGCFLAMTLGAVLFACLSYKAFKYFAWEFAKAIYRDFSAYVSTQHENPGLAEP